MEMDDQVLPILDFSEGLVFKQGSEEWKAMSNKVREACEDYGCFLLLVRDEIPMKLREEMVTAMKALFDLPEETKQKHTSPKPYQSYEGKSPVIPLNESFGIDDACRLDAAQAFTNLMWPQGNPAFCEAMKSMCSKMMDLNITILWMILESFGLGNHYDTHVQNTTSAFRFMKYKAPPPPPPPTPSNININVGSSTASPSASPSAALGLVPHTDKNTLTILCQNDVQGLEILTKQGKWVEVMVPEGAVVVFVGDALKAWSNGRLHAVMHRVMMSGDKERYSYSLFSVPKEEVVIEVPQEFIDKEHPLLYKPFNFAEYFTYFTSNVREDALELYAGVDIMS
ncbi:hypothetical protein ACFX13_017379 [Malus domestica]|uniref:2-oxoglutarate-dependent dioxygenase DAO n=1 Tax=Malus domestica TaxID=3750 RepID=A0A498HUE6_MALDO|nr:hypothetical protein DVH24_012187 [Malus domestica]